MTQNACVRVLSRTPNGLVPIGVIAGIPINWSTLSGFRQRCQEHGRSFMNEDDIFLYAPRGSRTLFCPVAKADEATFGLEEYLAGYGPTVIIQRGGVAQLPDDVNENQQVAAPSEVDKGGPVIAASYVLGCWGSRNPSYQANREEVVSYTVTPLPDYSFKENMTFCVFARALQDGRRCVLSVESPYHEKSVLSIGTCESSREVEAYTMASGTTKSGSHLTVQEDEWTHIALIWNASIHAVLLFVDGQQVKQAYLEQRDKVEFMQSLKELRLVLGRLKLGSRIAAGWDVEITNARLWQRALDEREIRAEADGTPKPLTSASLSTGGWRQC